MDLSCPLWGTATIFLIFGLEIIEKLDFWFENAQELSQFWFGNDEKYAIFDLEMKIKLYLCT